MNTVDQDSGRSRRHRLHTVHPRKNRIARRAVGRIGAVGLTAGAMLVAASCGVSDPGSDASTGSVASFAATTTVRPSMPPSTTTGTETATTTTSTTTSTTTVVEERRTRLVLETYAVPSILAEEDGIGAADGEVSDVGGWVPVTVPGVEPGPGTGSKELLTRAALIADAIDIAGVEPSNFYQAVDWQSGSAKQAVSYTLYAPGHTPLSILEAINDSYDLGGPLGEDPERTRVDVEVEHGTTTVRVDRHPTLDWFSVDWTTDLEYEPASLTPTPKHVEALVSVAQLLAAEFDFEGPSAMRFFQVDVSIAFPLIDSAEGLDFGPAVGVVMHGPGSSERIVELLTREGWTSVDQPPIVANGQYLAGPDDGPFAGTFVDVGFDL